MLEPLIEYFVILQLHKLNYSIYFEFIFIFPMYSALNTFYYLSFALKQIVKIKIEDYLIYSFSILCSLWIFFIIYYPCFNCFSFLFLSLNFNNGIPITSFILIINFYFFPSSFHIYSNQRWFAYFRRLWIMNSPSEELVLYEKTENSYKINIYILISSDLLF